MPKKPNTDSPTKRSQPAYHPAPKLHELHIHFPNLKVVKGKPKCRNRWRDSKTGDIYEWDKMHGMLERYSKNGDHLGEYNHRTGLPNKERSPSRTIEP